MAWSLSIFTIIIISSALVALTVGVGALRERPDPMAMPLAVLMGTVVAWAIPHAISLGYESAEMVVFWHKLRYPGTVFAPVAYLAVALTYAGRNRWQSRWLYAVLSILPVLTIAIVWTNQFHGLFWESISIATIRGATVLEPTYGPWYWVNLSYLYFVTIASLFILGSMVIRTGPIYRKQATLMSIGGFVPLTTNAAITFRYTTQAMVDFTTTALAVGGVTFALALFHFDLLEIRPVAYDLLIEELDDGVVIVGPDGNIRDYNPIAEEIFDDIRLDESTEAVLLEQLETDGGEIVAEVDGREEYYQVRPTSFTDERGQESGQIIYLNNVTDIVNREERISVLNRILRHNIRNDMNVVSGRLEILDRSVAPKNRDHVEIASKYTERILDFATKARNIERTLEKSGSTTAICTREAAARVVEAEQELHSDAAITFETATEAKTAIRVVDEDLFEMAVTELIDNAVTHSRGEAAVTINVEREGDTVYVRVIDNSTTIPAVEKEALASGLETDLEHGRGLGLWLVKWTVSLSSGELTFEEREPHGNVVTLSFPSADE